MEEDEMLGREIWWVLRRIHAERTLASSIVINAAEPFRFSPSDAKDRVPTYSTQLKILYLLGKRGIVELEGETMSGRYPISNYVVNPDAFTLAEEKKLKDFPVIEYFIIHLIPAFDSEYEKYKQKFAINDDSKSKRINIFVDHEKGIYRIIDGKPVRYPHVTCHSKIFLVIVYLKANGSSSLRALASHAKQLPKSTKRSIGAFNQLSRAKLKLSVEPITGDGIYELNSAHYEFV